MLEPNKTEPKASAPAEVATKQYAVYADYFKSGHRYIIAKTWTLDLAHLIAQRAEANLTDSEREVFGYTIGKIGV